MRVASSVPLETIYLIESQVDRERDLSAAGSLLGGAFARALARSDVLLFGLLVRADGYAALAHSPSDRLPAFVRDVQSAVAQRLNAMEATRGPLWTSRVRWRSMRSQGELFSVLVDLLVEPVEDGQIDDPGDWPLPSSYSALVEGVVPRFVWPDAHGRAGAFAVSSPLVHTPLPIFADLPATRWRARLDAAVHARLAAALRWRRAG
ncbi:MAG: hypothetical protein KC620_25090 [Myxococcales bacterium]|nr:hypothetical protein [Myxococcales bacterium]